ncbi:MAG: response regulator [Nitrospirae bacterium]|nr:MAG: response regulator [Nitrospirota bacterium]
MYIFYIDGCRRFLDLNLPKLNGHELLEKVRHSRLKNVLVVILTSSHASNDTNGSFGSDAMFYMTKPIDLQLLSMIPLFG